MKIETYALCHNLSCPNAAVTDLLDTCPEMFLFSHRKHHKVGVALCPITGKIYRHSSLITVGEVWEFRGNRFLRNEPGLPFIRCMAPHRYLSALFRVSSLSLQVIVLKLGQEDKASWQKSGFTIWPPSLEKQIMLSTDKPKYFWTFLLGILKLDF